MRRFWLVLAAAAIMLAAGVASAQSADTLTSFAQRGNLRAGPGTDWAILGTYDPGTPFRADGQAFTGAWVRGIAPDGKIGWAFHEALTLTQADAATMRPVYQETPFTLSAPSGGSRPAAPAAPPAQPAAPPAAPAAAAAPASSGGSGVQSTTTDRVNMRVNPGQTIMQTLPFGTAITIDGKSADGNWVRVSTPDGARGWIAVNFVRITEQQYANLPVVSGGAIQPGGASAPAAASAPSSAPAGPVVNTAPVSGFAYGGHIANLSDTTIQRMREAGMTWIKKQIRYPGGGGASIISAAHSAGFRVILGVVGSPSQVMDPAYQDAFAAHLGSLAAAGADAIEVWNEPNIDREWAAGSISPQAFTELLRKAYTAIKAANPNTLVISGAPAPTGFFGGCSGAGCDDNLFIAGMAAAGAANYIDCVGIHYNEGIVPPNATSGDPRGASGHYTRYLPTMISTYNNAFGGARPLCFTELGYLSPEGYGPLPGPFAWASDVTVAQQAAWLADAIAISRRSNVRLVIIWNVDFSNYGADPMAGYAMIRPDGSCPACAALGR